MGSLPSLESRTWPLSSFSVYSIFTAEPFSTVGLDCAPAGAAASTNSATRVPRKRMAHPPSRYRELPAAKQAYTRPRRGANFGEGRPGTTSASWGRLAQLGQESSVFGGEGGSDAHGAVGAQLVEAGQGGNLV